MKNEFNSLKDFLTPEEYDEVGFPTAHISGKTTGLPMFIWVCEKWFTHRKIKPVLLIARNYSEIPDIEYTFAMDISNPSKMVISDKGEITDEDVEKIKQWILLNKKTLIKYWKNDISTADLFRGEDELRKVE